MLRSLTGKGNSICALDATFVIDVDGTIACVFVGVGCALRAEPTEIVKEFESLVKRTMRDY